jgi:DNA-binding transcriptional LysR family regulator
MDVRRLRYFVAVAGERSFTKAAEKLHMAQPPLSKRIQEIEDEIGTRLFNRDIRPLELTVAGHLFYEQALQVLQRLDQLEATMKDFLTSSRPHLTIGLIPSGFYERLPQFIRRYRTKLPDVEVKLVELSSIDQIKALQDGRIDVGLGRVRIEGDGIKREVLREEPVLAVLPSPGAGKILRGAIDILSLSRYPLIVYPQGASPSFADLMLSIFRDAGMQPEKIIYVREMQTALVMVASGIGASLIPASAKRLVHPDSICRPLTPSVTTSLVLTHRSGDTSAQLMALLQTVKDIYPEWGFSQPLGKSDGAT